MQQSVIGNINLSNLTPDKLQNQITSQEQSAKYHQKLLAKLKVEERNNLTNRVKKL
jgi:hypothetical protein